MAEGILGDIVEGLLSFAYDVPFEEKQRDWVSLRQRSHELTLNMCAHACFFSAAVCLARLKMELMLNAQGTTQVGVIGGGRLGRHIVQCLLRQGHVSPSNIVLSSRQPDTLVEYKQQGVNVCFDNARIAESCHVVIIACLPLQLPEIAKEIKGLCRGIVYSLALGSTASSLGALISSPFVICPLYMFERPFSDDDQHNPLHHGKVHNQLSSADVCRTTSPFNPQGHVSVSQGWIADAFAVLTRYIHQVVEERTLANRICCEALFGIGDEQIDAVPFSMNQEDKSDRSQEEESTSSPLLDSLEKDGMRPCLEAHYIATLTK